MWCQKIAVVLLLSVCVVPAQATSTAAPMCVEGAMDQYPYFATHVRITNVSNRMHPEVVVDDVLYVPPTGFSRLRSVPPEHASTFAGSMVYQNSKTLTLGGGVFDTEGYLVRWVDKKIKLTKNASNEYEGHLRTTQNQHHFEVATRHCSAPPTPAI